MLGSIKRADVIKSLDFRKAPQNRFHQLLESVNILFAITKVDINLITSF